MISYDTAINVALPFVSYANQALLVNEFRGVTMMRTGDQILEQDYGYQDVDLWFSIAMVGGY